MLILGTWIVAISQFTQPLGGTAPQNWWLGHPSAHSSRARWCRRSPDLAVGSTVSLKETICEGSIMAEAVFSAVAESLEGMATRCTSAARLSTVQVE